MLENNFTKQLCLLPLASPADPIWSFQPDPTYVGSSDHPPMSTASSKYSLKDEALILAVITQSPSNALFLAVLALPHHHLLPKRNTTVITHLACRPLFVATGVSPSGDVRAPNTVCTNHPFLQAQKASPNFQPFRHFKPNGNPNRD